MTSNQLSYWRNEEEKRANREKEAENRRHNVATEGLTRYELEESRRHNVSTEELKRLDQALESRNLDQKAKQLLTQMAELYMTQGATAWSQLPDSLQNQIADLYDSGGLKSYGSEGYEGGTFSDVITGIYKEFKDLFKGGGAKIISALF